VFKNTAHELQFNIENNTLASLSPTAELAGFRAPQLITSNTTHLMELAIAVAFVLVGFILLMWSADLLVDNASALATNLGVSTLLVGIVIVGFGTSAPELFVSAMAALENKGNLALGNALGSNITNIGMVLGSAALVRALSVPRKTATRDLPLVIFGLFQ